MPLVYSALISANIDIKPDTLNKESQSEENTVTSYIEIPGYDVNDIDLSTVTLSTDKGTIPALVSPTQIGDYDSDGITDRMIKFDRQAVIGIVDVGDIEATISSKISGQTFEGTMLSM